MADRFAWRHARREARASVRRLGAYMLTITLGVAALVAINSFRANAVRSVENEARALLGADLRLSSNRAFPDSVLAVVDSLVSINDARRSTLVTTLSVAVTEAGRSRLVQLRAVAGEYPFYGKLTTEPAGVWGSWGDSAVIVEPAVLRELGAAIGDTLRIGRGRFLILGVVHDLPPEFAFQNAIGPRVFLARAALDSAGVIAFGSIARHQVFVALPDRQKVQRFVDLHHDYFTRNQVDFDTADEQAENLAEALDALGRFLGVVGLAALLLGGLGVGSAVNVFVRDRRDMIAVLRCVGATRATAFGAYLLQAVALGFAGAALGVVAGIGVQFALPLLLGGTIPFEVQPRIEWDIAALGLLLGGWVAFVFALLPLLAVRTITPLRALRQDVEGGERWWRDPWHWSVLLLLLATIAGLSIWQTGRVDAGLAFTGVLLAGLFLLWGCAGLLVRATRRWRPRGASYEVRQGIANLFRPQNQTTIVTMAVGFGIFLISSLWVVQTNLLGWLDVDGQLSQPNLVAFDIQQDQLADVRARVAGTYARGISYTPIVPARLAAINGVPAEELLSTPREPRVEPWAVRREYRHSYRDSLGAGERVIEGRWWDELAPESGSGVARVSAEKDVAQSLGVGIGDRITWNVQGVQLETVITSIREVDWARFDTNFFFVFEPGTLEAAPQTWVALIRADSAGTRATLQRDIVLNNPNVSVIDLATLQASLEKIVGRVALAIRFMSLFSVIGGTVVLVAALAAGRFARVRETALLRTIGARDRQVRRILLTEYAALGALAGATGVTLGGVAGWLMIRFFFNLDFELPLLPLLAAWLGAALLSLFIGSLLGRDALRRPPLATLREAAG